MPTAENMFKDLSDHARDVFKALGAGSDAEASRLLVCLCADLVQTHLGAESGDVAVYYLDEDTFLGYIGAEREDQARRANDPNGENS